MAEPRGRGPTRLSRAQPLALLPVFTADRHCQVQSLPGKQVDELGTGSRYGLQFQFRIAGDKYRQKVAHEVGGIAVGYPQAHLAGDLLRRQRSQQPVMGHQEACRLAQQLPACRSQLHRLVAAGKQLLPDLFFQFLDLRGHRRWAAVDIVGCILETA
ncbi:hypothetical protein D9M71_644200 [compost metagenome]